MPLGAFDKRLRLQALRRGITQAISAAATHGANAKATANLTRLPLAVTWCGRGHTRQR
jgi:hypothetical protein